MKNPLKAIFGEKKLPPPSSIMANQTANESGLKDKHKSIIYKAMVKHGGLLSVEQIAELTGLEKAQVYRRMSELWTDELVDKFFNSEQHGKTSSGVKCQLWQVVPK